MSQNDMLANQAPPSSDQPSNKQGKEEEMSEALRRWMAKRDILAAIPLAETLEALGGRPAPRERGKWKIDGVGNIVFKGQKWLNVNTNISGFGSVKLVMHALDLKDTPAMNWLAERFPRVPEGDWVAPEQQEEEERGFAPPPRSDEASEKIRDYLVGVRRIPAELVDAEMKAGRIYATEYRSKDEETGVWSSDYRAVFIGPSSAELRSTQPSGFKGCCPGSDSERSGYQVMFRGQSDGRVGIVEAAIDALSYNALNPGRYCYSTNGAGRFHLQYRLTLEAWRNGMMTDLALDADLAGDVGAQMVFNALFLRDYLAEKLDVQPEQIDEWLLTNRIKFQGLESPHTLFFSAPASEKDPAAWQVHRRERNPDRNAPVENRLILVKTEELAAPTVCFTLEKTTNGMKRGKHEVQIDLATIEAVKKKYRVNRDRPVLGKDWNDVWIKTEMKNSREKDSAPTQDTGQGDKERVPTGRFARRMR